MEKIRKGSKFTNKEIAETFKCSNQGGVRKSKTSKAIVLIAKLDNCLYKHYEDGDTFYFIGEGRKGNQEFKRGNKSILNASEEGFSLHLFTVEVEGEYVYKGVYKLSEKPFFKKMDDEGGNERDVLVFPIKN